MIFDECPRRIRQPSVPEGGGECVSNLLETAVAISVGYKGVRSAE